MLLHLIQDCSISHAIDKIELVSGHRIGSSLLNAAAKTPDVSVSLTSTPFVVQDRTNACVEEEEFGIWFALHLLEWISINCANRQIEWCFHTKEPASIKYLEDDGYNINLDEMFDSAQRLIDCVSDEDCPAADRHDTMVQVLYHQVLPLITISQDDLDLVKLASDTQEQFITQLDGELEAYNHMVTAFKITMANLQKKILPDLAKYSQIRSLYPDVTEIVSRRLEKEMSKLKKHTLNGDVSERVEQLETVLKSLHKKPRKTVSSGWKRKHGELLEEVKTIFESYKDTHRDMESVRAKEIYLLSAKVKAIQVKEELRNVCHRLGSDSLTYGYDIPAFDSRESVSYSHRSLYDSVLSVIQDVTQDVGRQHMNECNWIIEQCELTRLAWMEDPSLIPTFADNAMYDTLDGEFLVLHEPDIFSVMLDKISQQCAFTVGRLIKLLPRVQSSPAATKRLILTYETIVYKRVAEYITSLLEVRYKGVLDQLTKDVRHLSWQELDIEEVWLLKLLNSPTSSSVDTPTHPSTNISTPPVANKAASPSASIQLGAVPVVPQSNATQSKGTESIGSPMPSSAVVLPSEATQSGNAALPGHTVQAGEAVLHVNTTSESTSAVTSDMSTPCPRCRCHSDSGYHELKTSSDSQIDNVDGIAPQHMGCPSATPAEFRASCEVTGKPPCSCHDLCSESPDTANAGSNKSPSHSKELPHSADIDVSPKRAPMTLALQHTTLDTPTDASRCTDSSNSNCPPPTAGERSALPVTEEVLCAEGRADAAEGDLVVGTSLADAAAVEPTVGAGLTKAAAKESILGAGMLKAAADELAVGAGAPRAHADLSLEIEGMLDEALMSLDETLSGLIDTTQSSSSSQTSSSVRGRRPQSVERQADIPKSENRQPLVRSSRSKSVGAKPRGRWNKESEKPRRTPRAFTETCPLPSPQSPSRMSQIHAQTRKGVESIVLKRRSRLYQSRRSRSSKPSSDTTSVLAVGTNLFTMMFKDSIQSLLDMRLRHSPLEKAQMLAKCLRCISTTISQIRATGATTSDDLVTVAIVLLLNLPTQHFRSVYVQLKFISTYMDEFMDAGIHNFACVQFIGAMHFIQDQVLTKKYRVPASESRC